MDMLKFTQLLTPENIRQGAICSSKKAVLEMIGRIIAEQIDCEECDEIQCFESLFERERLGCTALGAGVAMPRARLPLKDKVIAVFLQLETPIDYDAPDHRKVDLIFAIMISPDLCSTYQCNFAEIAEKLTDKNFTKQLRQAQNADEIWQVFEFIDNLSESEQQAEIQQRENEQP